MIDTIHRQVDEYLNPLKKRRFLRFSRELEKRFEAYQGGARLRESIIASAIACLLYDLFLVSDYLLNPANIWYCIFLRLCIFTPGAMAAMGVAYIWRTSYVRDSVCVIMTAVAGWCMLGIYFGHSVALSALAQGGMLLVMSVGTLILRLSLPYVVALNAILFCEDVAFLHGDKWLNSGEKVTCVFLIGSFALMSIISNFRTETLERRYFLLFLREDLRSRRYALLNQDLTDLSKRDGLTGLYNRRHFDEYLAMVWESARLGTGLVSIIMVDIDRFKHLNDNFGHLCGDQVLAAIADILRSSIRGKEDVVARFGGDEFVVILPFMDRVQASETAERFCNKVRQSVFASHVSGVPLPITISCGVATALPADLLNASELVALADRALYRAKSLGRDQVCCASGLSKTEQLP
ncbi:MAG: GGDEF domain-containing protein [Terracidiphilus sp.]